MGRPAEHSIGEYKYIHKLVDITKVEDAQLIGRGQNEVKKFAWELLGTGFVIEDLIFTDYKGKLYIQNGVKRILSSRFILKMTDEEIVEVVGPGHNVNKDDFRHLSSKVFKGVNPDDAAAWAIILNEQRSDNHIQMWMRMQAAQKAGEWDEIVKTQRLNPQRFKKVERLNNLADPAYIFDQFRQGNVAETTIFQMSSLGKERQKYLMDMLKEKGKLTAVDVKDAQSARVTAVLANVGTSVKMPNITEIAKAVPKHEQLFAILDGTELIGPFQSFNEAFETSRENEGGDIYRLILVKGGGNGKS